MAKPIRALELHYPMIEFLIICICHFEVVVNCRWAVFGMLCFLLLAIAQNCTGDMGPNASTLVLAKEAIFEFK